MMSTSEMSFVPSPVKPNVPYDTFSKIDVRVGTITRVDDVSGSDKLSQLSVHFGDHERTILAGLRKEREDHHEIEGTQALFVVNLEPREILGHTSEGMLFDIGYEDGIIPALAVPERPVPNGTRLG